MKDKQERLKKNPKKKPCAVGEHVEIIEYPEVPPGEEKPEERLKAMKRAGATENELAAARHNIDNGSITHGKQLSRKLTPEEEKARKNGDDQKIIVVCVICQKSGTTKGKGREIDQAPDKNTPVEAKKMKSWGKKEKDQARNNAQFSKQSGKKAVYKIPSNQVSGQRGREIAKLFNEMKSLPPKIFPL